MNRSRMELWVEVFFFVVLTFASNAFASDNRRMNAILVTLDGVRWQEFFHGIDAQLGGTTAAGTPIFSSFWSELATESIVFGDRRSADDLIVANTELISLPAYQSIMAGSVQDCLTNHCGRVRTETLQERLVRELNLRKTDVATIASWDRIADAVESREGVSFVNAGLIPLDDQTQDPELNALNRQQVKDSPPWDNARYDKYTFAHAMRYLKTHRPRFMFISLNDSDELAHRGQYQSYIKTLHLYDRWIKELVMTLKGMGDYGANTTLIVTTDHGRGDGSSWTEHGARFPEAKYIWLFGRGPFIQQNRATFGSGYSHLDIRPTIEAALGLAPRDCQGCGTVIREIVNSN